MGIFIIHTSGYFGKTPPRCPRQVVTQEYPQRNQTKFSFSIANGKTKNSKVLYTPYTDLCANMANAGMPIKALVWPVYHTPIEHPGLLPFPIYPRPSNRARSAFSHSPLYLKYWGPAMEVLVFSKCFASAVRDQVSLPKLCCSTDVKSFLSSLANFPNRFISADIPDFQP